MDIGTAKPAVSQRGNVPHHLVDVTTPDKPWSLARYLREARAMIGMIHRRGHLPFLVGGTGQYIRGLLEGWSPPPKARDRRLRRELELFAEEHGTEALHRKLEEVDPVRARKLDHRNVRRVVRALEIYRLTGEPPSAMREKSPPDYDLLQLGLTLPREKLYDRIDRRVDRMLQAGLVEEVRSLLAGGLNLETPAFSAIGYRQIGEYLLDQCTFEEAVREIRRVTRQFVRRQANWFKADDPEIEWYRAEEGVVPALTLRIKQWLEMERGWSFLGPEEGGCR